MTNMERLIRDNIKARLAGHLDMVREHKQLSAELEELEALMRSPKVQSLDGMPKGFSGGNPTEQIVLKHQALLERYRVQLQDLLDGQAEVEQLIQNLEPIERTLARYRYIKGLSWEEVCVKMSYSWSQTHRIHSRLLDKLVEEVRKRGENHD